MNIQHVMLRLLTLTVVGTAAASPVESFDDIEFWVGSGTNRTALAIDWDGESASDNALVWGYRWDGDETPASMLREVVSADPRLFAKLGAEDPVLGVGVFGVGYDADDDGDFSLIDGTVFDADGIAVVDPADGAFALGDDLYAEGWQLGFWHYGLGSTTSSGLTWASSPRGPSGRTLVNGEWNSFAYSPMKDVEPFFRYDEFAENLAAAVPPTIDADFNGDGLIDAIDYTVWRDSETLPPAGYAAWVANYGTPAATAIPEPANGLLMISLLLMRYTLDWRDP